MTYIDVHDFNEQVNSEIRPRTLEFARFAREQKAPRSIHYYFPSRLHMKPTQEINCVRVSDTPRETYPPFTHFQLVP